MKVIYEVVEGDAGPESWALARFTDESEARSLLAALEQTLPPPGQRSGRWYDVRPESVFTTVKDFLRDSESKFVKQDLGEDLLAMLEE